MTGNEPRTFGIGSDCSTNWATTTTTAQDLVIFTFDWHILEWKIRCLFVLLLVKAKVSERESEREFVWEREREREGGRDNRSMRIDSNEERIFIEKNRWGPRWKLFENFHSFQKIFFHLVFISLSKVCFQKCLCKSFCLLLLLNQVFKQSLISFCWQRPASNIGNAF